MNKERVLPPPRRVPRVWPGLFLGLLLAACAGSPPVVADPPAAALWDARGSVWDAPATQWGP